MPKDVLYGKTLRKSFARYEEIQDMPNLLRFRRRATSGFSRPVCAKYLEIPTP